MSSLRHINQDVFPTEVLQAGKPVLVDFGAVWCSPCKMLDPVVEALATEWGDKVKVVKIDVDHNPDIAVQYQVLGLPALILFINGQPRERLNGFKPKKQVQAKFEPYFN